MRRVLETFAFVTVRRTSIYATHKQHSRLRTRQNDFHERPTGRAAHRLRTATIATISTPRHKIQGKLAACAINC